MNEHEQDRWSYPGANKALELLTANERAKFLASIVDKYVKPVDASDWRSLHYRMIQAFAEFAYEHAVSQGMDTNAFELDYVWRGFEIVECLRLAVTDNLSSTALDAKNFWVHNNRIVADVRAGRETVIWRRDVENAAELYFALPYRVPVFERLLVDVLVATELHAFLIESIGSTAKSDEKLGLSGPSSMLRRHPLWGYVRGCAIDFVFCCIAAVALGYAASFWSQTAAIWIVVILALLFVGFFVLKTAMLPFAWSAHRKAMGRLSGIVGAMIHTYHELQSTSTVSAQRMREVATKASDAGVSWPSPLFVLLDENIRHGRQLAAPIFGASG